MYKYDLGQTLIMYVVIVTFCKVSCIARVYRDNVRESEREREREPVDYIKTHMFNANSTCMCVRACGLY